jgi:hypothetical protein
MSEEIPFTSRGKKASICLIGSGQWGSKVESILKLHNYYDLKGVITSKTSEEQKKEIISQSEFVYIATPQIVQYEYLMYSILENKKIICETPFLSNHQQRMSVKNTLYQNGDMDFVYANYPYVFDSFYLSVIARVAKKGEVKYLSISCKGPKYRDNASDNMSKKYYMNQAIALAFKASEAKGIFIDKISFTESGCVFSFNDDFVIHALCGVSDVNEATIIARGNSYADDLRFTYDEFDQVVPMLNFFMNYHKVKDAVGGSISLANPSSFIDEALRVEAFSDLYSSLKGKKHEINMRDYMLSSTNN